MKKILSYLLFIALCLVYFSAGYILGFYQGNVSAYSDRLNQVNNVFDGK